VRRYLILLHAPHGRRLLAGGALVRPGQAAQDLVVVLALHWATGSFALGGAAVAALTVTSSISTVAQGRLMDRLGTRRVLAPTAAGFLAATGILSAALALRAPALVLLGLAGAVGGLLPAAGPPLRNLWASLLEDPGDQSTAFAYESLAQDVGYIAGPAALGPIAAALSPIDAVAASGVLIAAGALTISTIPAIHQSPDATAKLPSPRPGIIRPLACAALTLFAVGGALGAIDLSTPAFALQHGAPAITGLLLGAFSAGSAAGGLFYGARTWRSRPASRLLACVVVLAALLLLPAASPSLPLLALALIAAGIPLAASLTTAYLLANDHVPSSRRTEAFAWLSLTLNAGVAVGTATAGTIATHSGATHGFLLASACATGGGAILAVSTTARRRHKRPDNATGPART
jgi:MFS family permease